MHGKTASHWQLHPARQRRLGTGIALLLGLVFIGSSLLLWPIDNCSPARSRAVMAKGQRPVPPPLRSRLGPDERRLRQVIQAEAFDAAHSARVENGFVSYLDPGDWLCLRQIDFGSGATHFNARITAHPGFAGNNVEVRLGSATGRVVARLKTEPTGGWFTFTEQMAEMTARPQGVHDVYITFSGGVSVCNIDWIRFLRRL